MIAWLNGNQGVVAVVIFILGAVGFFLRKVFFSEKNGVSQSQKSGDNSINIQSGKDTNL